jgi:DNA integrity scanning protein DisA with diadenylate cyclase activity
VRLVNDSGYQIDWRVAIDTRSQHDWRVSIDRSERKTDVKLIDAQRERFTRSIGEVSALQLHEIGTNARWIRMNMFELAHA